jgi:pimeloyl-ACP methyl ester carboxylesterase
VAAEVRPRQDDQHEDDWFRYFPGDVPAAYRWSAAFSLLLGTAHWGGAALSEVHRVGTRLADRLGDDEAWFAEFRAAGDRAVELAEADERAGHALTAAGDYLRACDYYQIGERFRLPKDEAALEVYRESLACFRRYAELTDGPLIEPVEVPFADTGLPAYFVRAAGATDRAGPATVFFDGLDITKEMQFTHGVSEISRRGVHCLVVDGPGNGEAIRFRGLPLRPDYEVAGSAAYEYLAGRPEVDADRIGVMAISLGGYYAPRCAAKEPRFAGCVAWGAIWDYHRTWQRRLEVAGNASMSVAMDHIAWVLGVDTVDEAMTALQDFRLEGVVDDLTCPLLVTHGENDAQVPLADARRLFEAAGSTDKTLRSFGPEEGGAQHCQIDFSLRGVSVVADWLRDTLKAG